jgi:hypothetical protein
MFLPKTWGIKDVQSEFPASIYMIWKAKKTCGKWGILSSPNPTPGGTFKLQLLLI